MLMVRLPPHAPGMRIGLYGGTFNPAHAGHRHVSLLALTRIIRPSKTYVYSAVLDSRLRRWLALGHGEP